MKCRTNFPNSSPKGTLPFPHSSPPHLRSSKTPPLISNRRARRELIPLTQIRPSVLIYWLHFVGLFDVMLRGWVRRGRFQLLVLIGWNRPDLPWVFSYFACFLPSWYGWGYWGICLIFWGFFNQFCDDLMREGREWSGTSIRYFFFGLLSFGDILPVKLLII